MTINPRPTVTVDCAGVATQDEFWQAYIDAARPVAAELFGRNLDAFWDAVEARGPGWPGEVRLVFSNASSLKNLKLRGGGLFLDALRKIADEATQVEIQLA